MLRSLDSRLNVAGASSEGLSQYFTVLIIVLLATVVIGVWAHFFFRRRRIVSQSSDAIQQLESLNASFRNSLSPRKPIDLVFAHAVRSKSQFDRFDLKPMTQSRLLDHAQWVENEIRGRMEALAHFDTYRARVASIASAALGRSSDTRLNAAKYAKLEARLFSSRQLQFPNPRARVIARVTYTSPQGRNSYSRQVTLGFDALRSEFAEAQAAKARQSTAAALRQRERSLMTNALRTQILRRDEFRCRMCGAAASDGVTLHVDHIEPVSLGGKTVSTNLQTLCAPCNLGKSNRFVG